MLLLSNYFGIQTIFTMVGSCPEYLNFVNVMESSLGIMHYLVRKADSFPSDIKTFKT